MLIMVRYRFGWEYDLIFLAMLAGWEVSTSELFMAVLARRQVMGINFIVPLATYSLHSLAQPYHLNCLFIP